MSFKLQLKNFSVPETSVQKAVLHWLRVKGVFAWRNNNTGIWDKEKQCYRPSQSIKGVSDVIGIYNGKMICIEIKSPNNNKRPEHQQEFLKNINDNGGIAFFCDSIKELEKYLLPIIRGEK